MFLYLLFSAGPDIMSLGLKKWDNSPSLIKASYGGSHPCIEMFFLPLVLQLELVHQNMNTFLILQFIVWFSPIKPFSNCPLIAAECCECDCLIIPLISVSPPWQAKQSPASPQGSRQDLQALLGLALLHHSALTSERLDAARQKENKT